MKIQRVVALLLFVSTICFSCRSTQVPVQDQNAAKGPETYLSHFDRAQALLDAGLDDATVESFVSLCVAFVEESLNADPGAGPIELSLPKAAAKSAMNYYAYARVFESCERLVEGKSRAIEIYQKALEIDPSQQLSKRRLALLLNPKLSQ